MPKRKHRESDEYIMRKIRRLEKKVKKRSRKRRSSSSPDSSDVGLLLQEDNQENTAIEQPSAVTDKLEDMVDIIISPQKDIRDPTLQLVESEDQITDPIIPDVPSTSVEQNEIEVALDESILELLGESPSKNKKYSAPIQNELAIRWEHIATTGLNKDIKKDLLEKYFLPENCQKIGSPQLNAEIKAALSDTLVKKDKVIETKQNQQAVAIGCIGQALTKIFASQNKDTEVIKLLLDAGKILCHSQYVESMSRRSFVTSTIKKDIKDQLYTTEIDSHLFGEKLSDTLKAAKAISKSGSEIKNFKTTGILQPRFSQSRSLNVRPPLPPARQVGAGWRPVLASQQPRRYQGPPPPRPPPPQAYQASLSTLPSAPPQRSRGRTLTRR